MNHYLKIYNLQTQGKVEFQGRIQIHVTRKSKLIALTLLLLNIIITIITSIIVIIIVTIISPESKLELRLWLAPPRASPASLRLESCNIII